MGSVAWGNSWASAWGDSWGAASPAPPVVTEARGGGFLDLRTGRKRSGEALRIERERLGILPKKVAQIVRKVAVEQVAAPERNLDAALHRALERKNLAYRALYAEVTRLEVEAQNELMQDDEEVLILLL